jgi:hypothetical protein
MILSSKRQESCEESIICMVSILMGMIQKKLKKGGLNINIMSNNVYNFVQQKCIIFWMFFFMWHGWLEELNLMGREVFDRRCEFGCLWPLCLYHGRVASRP